MCISFQLRSNAAFTHPWTDPVQDGGHDPARPSPGLRRLQDRCAEAELGEAVSHLPPDSGRRRVRGLEEQAEEGTDQLVRHDMAWEGPPAAPPPTPARDARSRRSRTAARVARGAQLPADDGSLPPSSRMPTRPAMRSDVEREERWASASAVAPPPGLRRASSNSLVTAMVLSHSFINVREQIGDR